MEIKTSGEVKQQQHQPKSQRPLAGFLETMCPKKHSYRIIVNRINNTITFHIFYHMVVISICNKHGVLFFTDTGDIPNKVVEQHRKRESLKGTITKRKVNLLRGKKTMDTCKG